MTIKTKKLSLAIGLLTVFMIMIIASSNEVSSDVTMVHSSTVSTVFSQYVVENGTQIITQVAYKLLQIN